ncbi:large conductance mechanosensitive channel protein MscL [Paucilactobacillus hokkaidonensis JCM 18461]|uniref:Large-conductance mechanosensitive channel n=2 Tax=Paucilactobacillus hokkaidonensis TaxID=1193095 RepID=A0A0A1GY43_9LACO|nr:large-conductance mechanosensitive channel protein MscL [Paucilactobacillus hokkaidonensis]KRO10103.1 large-conductance mechanosensitive channel [Paucilactobacillus hokkaidonensis]BAP85386.1 large conductance mechanosensitive channel protein MscL [Paucilactobacillus hokkaidonensis JCM 18461]
MLKEFKQFILRGNVVDLAVGVIIGSAFTTIVKSLTDNIISPFLGLFLGKIDFSDWIITLGSAEFKVGTFVNAVINFLIIAFVIFIMVKLINKFLRNQQDEETPAPTNEEIYLKEIRDLMEKQSTDDES